MTGVKRQTILHAIVARDLRQQPGVWMPVGTWPTRGGAAATDRRIRCGYQVYRPAGSFEARIAVSEDGFRVDARYVGDRAAAATPSIGGAE
jgi:hypothetical protein